MAAAAMAGASSATTGWPLPVVAAAPAASTTMLVSSQGSSRDGVVSRARARPGERSSRLAVRSSQPGWRRHTWAATEIHTRLRSTSSGGPFISSLPRLPAGRRVAAAGPGALGS